MHIFTSFLLTGIAALSVLTVSAQETATVTISPAPGEYDLLPSEFVITIDGPLKIAKNVVGGNPLLITSPSGVAQQLSGTYSDNTVTCTLPATSTFPLDENGEYTVAVRKNAITYTWADGSTSKSDLTEFKYNVAGNGSQGPDVPQPVAYDITLEKTTPSLSPLDLDSRTIETLQLYFSMGDLEVAADADALVTITGPNYRQTSPLLPNMNTSASTVFKALFTDPEYNGSYTLSIPQGVLGDKEWIENHEFGHANAAINYEFTVEGGKDPSEIVQDLTFNPFVTPAVGAKVDEISEVILLFESTPYWDEATELEVGYKSDPQMTSFTEFTTARIEKGEGNEAKLVLDQKARNRGEYSLTLPEGIFWNEDHQNDENAGALNSAMNLYWQVAPSTVAVNVLSHVPATDAKVSSFPADEPAIIINTDNNDAVAELKVKVVSYNMDSDSALPKTVVPTSTSDAKTDDGAPCWINNTGAEITFTPSCYYEVTFSLLNSEGVVLEEGLFEFYGDDSTGVDSISATEKSIIYDLKGVEVSGDAESLPAGLYIINGKKTLVVR